MVKTSSEAEVFFTDGCGRCALGGTPACKVHNWMEALLLLRNILLKSGLSETRKWGVPCYVLGNKNVVLLGVLKSCATLSFFKGSLMTDPKNHLQKPGENSQAARYMKFTSPQQVLEQTDIIADYIQEAIQLEVTGQRVKFKSPEQQPMCPELQDALQNDAVLSDSFYALTPGRQRGYILHFGSAKQAHTRMERIARCKDKILQGKGLHD